MRCAGVGKQCNEEGSAKENIPKYRSAKVYCTFSIILIYIGRNDNPTGIQTNHNDQCLFFW